MIREVKLYGHLRKKFGKLHHFDIKSPLEAIRALSANFKEFRAEFAKGAYAIVVNEREDIPMERLSMGGSGPIKIIPVAQGAGGNGWTNILIGAVLITAAFTIPGLAGAAAGSWQAMVAGSLYGMGASLVLGGISQLLARPPGLDKVADREDNQPSLAYDGAINTYAQGQPIPIGYGTLMIGSSVISASVVADAAPGSDTPTVPCGGGLPSGSLVKTTAGSTAIQSFVKDDEVLNYDAVEVGGPQGGTTSTIGYAGTATGTTTTLTFNDSAETFVCASDTDLWDDVNLGRIRADGLQVGDRITTATGNLTVATITTNPSTTVYQITEGWFAHETTGILFRNYRMTGGDDVA